jgi:hypothetical protein
MISRLRLPLALAAAASLLAGCAATLPKTDPALAGPFYTPSNVQTAPKLPEAVRRIAILPCAGADSRLTEDTLVDLDRILATALTRSARAEITQLDRAALARLAKRPRVLSTSVLPADFLPRLAAETGADALLLVDVTAHSPYPPLVLGLRARLVDLKTGEQLWNFDNIVSTTSPAVVNSARAHVLGRTSAPKTPGDLSYSILQNPVAFADFVAEITWATLPPR